VTGQTSATQTAEQAQPVSTDGHIVAANVRSAIEISSSRTDSKNSITVQVRATNAYFRIQPVRDPQQPRIWCVSVRQCSAGGVVDEKGLGWIDRPGTAQAKLAEEIDVIREDVGSWLAHSTRRDLCRWLLTTPPLPTAAELAGRTETTFANSGRTR
jgi:hypothetical protein